MATGTMNVEFLEETFEMPAFSFSAGTSGTYATNVYVDIQKQGYKPIMCSLGGLEHPFVYSAVISINSDNTRVYALIFRASGDVGSFLAGDVKAKVLYRKSS